MAKRKSTVEDEEAEEELSARSKRSRRVAVEVASEGEDEGEEENEVAEETEEQRAFEEKYKYKLWEDIATQTQKAGVRFLSSALSSIITDLLLVARVRPQTVDRRFRHHTLLEHEAVYVP